MMKHDKDDKDLVEDSTAEHELAQVEEGNVSASMLNEGSRPEDLGDSAQSDASKEGEAAEHPADESSEESEKKPESPTSAVARARERISERIAKRAAERAAAKEAAREAKAKALEEKLQRQAALKAAEAGETERCDDHDRDPEDIPEAEQTREGEDELGGAGPEETPPPKPRVKRERKRSAPKKESLEEELEDDLDEEEGEEEGELTAEQLEFVHDDPLAPAYDLEQGALLDSAPTAGLPWRADVKTAKGFFNAELLYRFDILEPDDQKKIAGTCRIELKGFQGGVWTIIAGDDIEVLNRKEDAELVLTMQQKDFLELVNGRINPQLAILGEKMKIQGDVRKALDFLVLLTPAPE